MNTLKINIPKGFQIDNFDKSTGEVNFVAIPKSPSERINRWLDILDHHHMTQEQFNKWVENDRPHEVGTKEVEMIVAAYNNRQLNDPLPKWGQNTGQKGMPWFIMPEEASGAGFAYFGYVSWRTASFVGARLVFFGDDWKENLIDATNKFLSSFEKSMTL